MCVCGPKRFAPTAKPDELHLDGNIIVVTDGVYVPSMLLLVVLVSTGRVQGETRGKG